MSTRGCYRRARARGVITVLLLCVASAFIRRVSEPRDVVSDFRFAEKQSFLHWGRLTSSDLPLTHTHTHTHTHTDNYNDRVR